MDSPDWSRPLDGVVLEPGPDWLDEFVHHCGRLGAAHLEGSAQQLRVTPYATDHDAGTEISVGHAADLLPRLRVEGDSLSVVGWGAADLWCWPEVVAEAVGAVGNSVQRIEWWAYLGPALGARGGALRFSGEPRIVGPLLLSPLSDAYVELDRTNEREHLGSRGGIVMTWWPLRVEGETLTYEWHTVGRAEPAIHLLRLSAILSIQSDCHIAVRQMPQPGPLNEPLKSPYQGPLGAEQLQVTEAPLTAWTSDAWLILESDDTLDEAAGMYAEGLDLRERHPSFALTAFISAIERVSQLQKGLERCATCNQVVGSTRRFQEAVEGALPPQHAAMLTDAYARRSKTVHHGVLHGSERRKVMLWRTSAKGPDFEYGVVRAAQGAARNLIYSALARSVT
jgi:hypothetical protein